MKDVLDVVGYAEAIAGQPMACRRPGVPLDPQCCWACPAWSVCRGLGVRHPGVLGRDGGKTTDPVYRYRVRWMNRLDQINNMKEMP